MCRTYGEYLQDKDIATGYLDICGEEITKIAEPAGRILARLDIAYVYHAIGETETGAAKLNEAIDAARGLEDQRKQAGRSIGRCRRHSRENAKGR